MRRQWYAPPEGKRKIHAMQLADFARKYIWWMEPQEAGTDPHRVIAQVMNIGAFEDATALRALVGDEQLKQAIQEARPGEFSERSWHYWHKVLGVSRFDRVPPLPVRKFG